MTPEELLEIDHFDQPEHCPCGAEPIIEERPSMRLRWTVRCPNRVRRNGRAPLRGCLLSHPGYGESRLGAINMFNRQLLGLESDTSKQLAHIREQREKVNLNMATSGHCRALPRPCLYEFCRYHVGGQEPCVLDVVKQGPLTLEEIGVIIGVTRERIRQIEKMALWKLWRRCRNEDGLKASDSLR